jgi:hypothetical protein
MRLLAVVFASGAIAALPSVALGSVSSKPRLPVTETQYVMRGVLTHYVPAAGAVDGSITIRVTGVNAAAGFTLRRTLTFRVTASTAVVFGAGGRIADGDIGYVKVASPPGLLATFQALQSLPASAVVDSPLPFKQIQPVFG